MVIISHYVNTRHLIKNDGQVLRGYNFRKFCIRYEFVVRKTEMVKSGERGQKWLSTCTYSMMGSYLYWGAER